MKRDLTRSERLNRLERKSKIALCFAWLSLILVVYVKIILPIIEMLRG